MNENLKRFLPWIAIGGVVLFFLFRRRSPTVVPGEPEVMPVPVGGGGGGGGFMDVMTPEPIDLAEQFAEQQRQADFAYTEQLRRFDLERLGRISLLEGLQEQLNIKAFQGEAARLDFAETRKFKCPQGAGDPFRDPETGQLYCRQSGKGGFFKQIGRSVTQAITGGIDRAGPSLVAGGISSIKL